MTKKQPKVYPAAKLPLSIAAVSSYLDTHVLGTTMAVVGTIDSTNKYIKKNISVLDDGFTIISEKQFSGRGRLGRTFESPEGGLYMSILLIGRQLIENVDSVTVRAAVAVKNAIKELTGLESVGIKWVNDIYCEDKKICGILAERIVRKGYCDFSVLGIGVNVTTPPKAFEGELKEIAGSISDFTKVDFSRNELAACILNHLEKTLYVTDKDESTKILDDYRDSSVIIGREVYISNGEKTVKAKVLGIDDLASIYVQYDDGLTEILRTGEVSTRLINEENK
jgi:BirA family biotin operon repressor/biotin-[acetyl-CoA-carboxylase] ligase